MKHFPIFLAVEGRRIVLAGGGDAALAKLRLLMKTEAAITVIAPAPAPEIHAWAQAGCLHLRTRAFEPGDALCATLVYAATEDEGEDQRIARLARADGALVNIVDNLADSQFITPAIVDRDPVTVAIGTEGAAPVLARKIKADLEETLPPTLGRLARLGKAFRQHVLRLPAGRARRAFWADYYFKSGPKLGTAPSAMINERLRALLDHHAQQGAEAGHVQFVGAGPGDPELLTLKARRALDEADVIVHDRLVPAEILELARREAVILDVGKTGFGPSTPQAQIDALIVEHAQTGAQVVRLKSGDPGVFGRLDEEIAACDAAGVAWSIVPGLTAATAATTALGQSMTQRGRNGALRILTGHDLKGFAEQDWRGLAAPGAVAALYMAKRAARFVQGRLMMYGADPATPISIVENASRPDQRIVATRLDRLTDDLTAADLTGPAVLMLGLAPRQASTALTAPQSQEVAL